MPMSDLIIDPKRRLIDDEEEEEENDEETVRTRMTESSLIYVYFLGSSSLLVETDCRFEGRPKAWADRSQARDAIVLRLLRHLSRSSAVQHRRSKRNVSDVRPVHASRRQGRRRRRVDRRSDALRVPSLRRSSQVDQEIANALRFARTRADARVPRVRTRLSETTPAELASRTRARSRRGRQ